MQLDLFPDGNLVDHGEFAARATEAPFGASIACRICFEVAGTADATGRNPL